MRTVCRLKIVLFLSFLAFLSPANSWAQSASNVQPPVAITGFAHQLIGDGRIHMNICQADSCVPGSKVSYRLFAPTSDPDFEEFKLTHEMVRARLQSRLPQGTVITGGTPERTQRESFTVFTITRDVRLPDGSRSITKSTHLFGERIAISLISSSQSMEVAEANSTLFMMALMLWDRSQAQHHQ